MNPKKNLKNNSVLFIFTAIMLFFWSEGLMLQIFQFNETKNILKSIAVILILFFSFLSLFSFKKDKIKEILHSKYSSFIFIILINILFTQLISSYLIFGESFYSALRGPLFFGSIFIFFILTIHSSEDSVNKINKLLIFFSLAMIVLQTFSAIFPELGVELLNEEAFISERFNRNRLTPLLTMASVIIYSTFYFTSKVLSFFEKKQFNKLFFLNISLLLIHLYYFLFIAMSRVKSISILVTILIFILIINNTKQLLRYLPIFVILLFILSIYKEGIFFEIISYFIQTIVEESQVMHSNVGVRIQGLLYNIELFKKSLFFGIGQAAPSSAGIINFGISNFSYNLADLGTFAMIILYGFPSLFITIYIYIHIFKDIFSFKKNSDGQYNILINSIAMFFIYRIVSFSHHFYWHTEAIWWGIIFFILHKILYNKK